MNTVTSKEMRRLEVNADWLGVTSFLLMENAGRSVAEEVRKRYSGSIMVVTGSGGKAGDGYVAARHLSSLGLRVKLAYVVEPSLNESEAARAHWGITRRHTTIEVTRFQGDVDSEVVVDAMLGTGFRGRLREPYKWAVDAINSSKARKVSIDIPSGLEADSESLTDNYVHAELVVTMHAPKPCLKQLRDTEIVVANIGIPREAAMFTGPGDIVVNYPRRTPLMKKGDGGRVVVIGGSSKYTGAPILTVMGAFRGGADMVHLVAPRIVVEAARNRLPELICHEYQGDFLNGDALRVLEEPLGRAHCVAIGPGLGFSDQIAETVGRIIEACSKRSIRIVVDADGIRCVGALMAKGWTPPPSIIYTPHAGEFEYLAGYRPSVELSKRVGEVVDLARKLRSTVLLKGNCDVVASHMGFRLSATGVPAMAVAGTGDVLTGLVSAIYAKGVEELDAAATAVCTLGLAGSLASADLNEQLIASDVAMYVPKVLGDPVGSAAKVGVRRLPQELMGDMGWLDLTTE